MIPLPYWFVSFRNILKLFKRNCLSGKLSSILVSNKRKMSNVPWITSATDSNLFRRELTLRWTIINLWGFDIFSFLIESMGFYCIVLNWLSKIFYFFTILQGELGSTDFKMVTLSFAGFSLWCHVSKISWFKNLTTRPK